LARSDVERFPAVTLGLQATWLVNFATHLWGRRRFENGRGLAIVGGCSPDFGEGGTTTIMLIPLGPSRLRWYAIDFKLVGIRVLQTPRAGPRNQAGSLQRGGHHVAGLSAVRESRRALMKELRERVSIVAGRRRVCSQQRASRRRLCALRSAGLEALRLPDYQIDAQGG